MTDLDAVLADLRAEGDDLDALVSAAGPAAWTRQTPAEGWTVAHQIAHLQWTDHVSALTVAGAAGDTDAHAAFDAVIAAAWSAPETFVDTAAAEGAGDDPADLLARWRRDRAALLEELPRVPAGVRIRWFGPPMSAMSMATARIMETWAHGQDIADTLGVARLPTARLRHVAHIGVRTRDFAYSLQGRTPPESAFRIQLTAPSGESWTWGPDDAADRVSGSALDFCLLVTQRVHRDDTDLVAVGDDAAEWLTLAQAFAGAPGGGRERSGAATGMHR